VNVRLAALLVLVLAHPACDLHGHGEGQAHSDDHSAFEHTVPDHPFDDVERWVDVFDDPDRAEWQKPGEVVEARPATDFVSFDFRFTGCPIERDEFLALVRAVLAGTSPELPAVPVCWECKTRELPCRVIYHQEICCGAMTRGGCGARCPGHGVACAGCRGPVEEPNYDANVVMFADRGLSWKDIAAKMRVFSAPVWMSMGLEEEARKIRDE